MPTLSGNDWKRKKKKMNRGALLEIPLASRKCQRACLAALLIFSLLSFSGCISHLQQAKLHYTQAQKHTRLYDSETAMASFERALDEAGRAVNRHPTAQAYMLKGMAELNLKMWKEAGESFRNAFSLGFEKGEEWAQDLSLFGLASSLEELGVESQAFRVYGYLLQNSRFRPVLILASQKHTQALLQKALEETGKEREKLLSDALKSAEKLTMKDFSCGFYHYLLSQVFGHLGDYQKSFDEALMARELGLPAGEVFRDNDLQIVFCYRRLKEMLSHIEWKEFESHYLKWVKRWKWRGPETPDWKEKEEHEAFH